MQADRRLRKLLVALTVLSLLLAACSPMPPLIRGPAATRSVFVPGVVDAGEALSPLQPTPVAPAAETPAGTATPADATPTSAPTATPPPTATPRPSLQGPVWQWTTSKFKDGSALAPIDRAKYTVEMLPDGNALILADCNFGTGTYRSEDDQLSFGPIGATKMACPPDSLDSAFLAQLSKVERFEFDGRELALMLQDEAGEMRMAAQENESEPTAIPPTVTPTPLPVTPPPPASPTMTATARIETPAPIIVRPTATRILPPPTSQPATPTRVPATPTQAPPTAAPVPPSATPIQPAATVPPIQTVEVVFLPGTAWTVERLVIDGREVVPAASLAPTIEISADGNRASGSTGCNIYRAGAMIDAGTIEFVGPALLTRKTCPGTVMLLEVEFIDALLKATNYTANIGLLVLTGADGQVLLTLLRK